MDESLKIVFANSAAEALLGLGQQQVLHCSFEQAYTHTSLDLSRVYKVLEDKQNFTDSEVHFTFNNGSHALTEVTTKLIEEQSPAQLLMEIRQIDQQKRISQETLQWSQQQAAQELVRGLAHEIKNPLGGLRGAAQLLDKELETKELKEYTSMIIEQSDRLTKLVDRLLGPNRPSDVKQCNLHEILEKIMMLCKADNPLNIKLLRDYDPSIPEVSVDSDQIMQAILNIVRNAFQALQDSEHETGQIRFVTRIERQLTIHGKRHPLCALIKIVDNGPGIPDALKDTLFYPMVSGKKEGSGLGLSIAQNLIDHHGGKVEVDSWVGNTEFSIYLPIDYCGVES